MKTPWKFLAQLASRRPSGKAQESSAGNDTKSQSLEHTSALPPSPTLADSPLGRNEHVLVDQGPIAPIEPEGHNGVAQALEPPIDADEAQTTARDEADQLDAEANSLVPKSAASTKSHRKPRIKRRERGKRANAHVAAQSAVVQKDHQSLQQSSSCGLFFHELATLDEEIKMLRTQLAQKLHLQNVQLKKMLERFELS
ncbi:hypothetical protein GOA74_24335 [Sinorhizobium meliloti]|nr:hypothetical protein [Sinorhizobium meliloti]MDW9942514.1 hypothetical protein [Sinorhizobium meliloti]